MSGLSRRDFVRRAMRSSAGLSLLPILPAGALALQDPATESRRGDVTKESQAAAAAGLRWLAGRARPDGSWAASVGYKLNTGYNVTEQDAGHTGITALACMAYLAGGHLPGRGRWGREVEDGLRWILDQVQSDGYITANGSRMYSHAFATLALAEAYGMGGHLDIRERLQRSVDLIVKCQNREGGWRYRPFAADSDMSVTVCQVMALRAARNIGINVPKATIERASRYVGKSAVRQGPRLPAIALLAGKRSKGSFLYQPDARSRISFAMTAAGVAALHGTGNYSAEDIRPGLDALHSEQDLFSQTWGVREDGHYFFYYGHYYATQAMYVAGGDDWARYWPKVRDALLRMQRANGSWQNRVGPGDAFGTAVACLILQLPYRYLPIFQR